MTPSELKYEIESRGRESHFFDRKTMQFFGDTMSNFGVRCVTVRAMSERVNPETGRYEFETVDAWELYRRRPVKSGCGSFYFRRDNFRRLYSVEA